MERRICNYSLGTILLLFVGMIVSAFSFGSYSMLDVVSDVSWIICSVVLTDCTFTFIKGCIEIKEGK